MGTRVTIDLKGVTYGVAAEADTPLPEEQIRSALNGHMCRYGTYPRILTAIQKAAACMAAS